MQIISKKVKISTNFWKPNLLNPLCDNGCRIIVRFSGKGTLFWKVRFSGRTKYDFLEKVHFSGTPQKAGAQVRIYVCAPFGND